jgi:hypothetical protein
MRRRGILPLLLLGFALTARHRWCMVTLGVLGGTCQIACTKDCKIRSQPEDLWKRPGKVVPWWAAYRVFGSTLQGLNQLIVGSHHYPRLLTPLVMRFLMIEVDEYYV